MEYLQQNATDEEDKTLLNDTLDTLKTTKYKLADSGFTNSWCRPIETSFRMFHSQQFIQQSNLGLNPSLFSINGLWNSSMTGLNNNVFQKNAILNICNTTQALVSNISVLTQRKINEIESKVESFKLPAHISKPIVHINSDLDCGSGSGVA